MKISEIEKKIENARKEQRTWTNRLMRETNKERVNEARELVKEINKQISKGEELAFGTKARHRGFKSIELWKLTKANEKKGKEYIELEQICIGAVSKKGRKTARIKREISTHFPWQVKSWERVSNKEFETLEKRVIDTIGSEVIKREKEKEKRRK